MYQLTFLRPLSRVSMRLMVASYHKSLPQLVAYCSPFNNNFVLTAVSFFAIFHFDASLLFQKYSIVCCRGRHRPTTVCQVLCENEHQANNLFCPCIQSDLSQTLDDVFAEPLQFLPTKVAETFKTPYSPSNKQT